MIEHAEHDSLKRNDTEIAILAPIIEAARDRLGLDAEDGLGVVVPHRAQRAALKALFPDLAAAGAIDTVERFQGGERDLIVVSATASDPEFVLAEARFLLNPNRLNVAFSRPRKKLIVIGSTHDLPARAARHGGLRERAALEAAALRVLGRGAVGGRDCGGRGFESAGVRLNCLSPRRSRNESETHST